MHRLRRIVAYDEGTTMADIVRAVADVHPRHTNTPRKSDLLFCDEMEFGVLLPQAASRAA